MSEAPLKAMHINVEDVLSRIGSDVREKLAPLVAKHPPLYVGKCFRLTSKRTGKSIERFLYLTQAGVLLVLTADGVRGKRIEDLRDPTVVHSVFLSKGSATAPRVVFHFKRSKDLAIEFPDPLDDEFEPFATALRSVAGATETAPTFPISEVPDAFDATSAAHRVDKFRGHGDTTSGTPTGGGGDKPLDGVGATEPVRPTSVERGNVRPNATDDARGDAAAVGDSSIGQETPDTRVAASPPTKAKTQHVSFADPLGLGIKSLTAIRHAEAQQKKRAVKLVDFDGFDDEHQAASGPLDVVGVYMMAEGFLLELDNQDLQEDVAWITHATQERLRAEQRERQRQADRAVADAAAMRQLNQLVLMVCRKQMQKVRLAEERQRERHLGLLLKAQRRAQHPEDTFLSFGGEGKYLPSSCGTSTTQYTEYDPLNLFSRAAIPIALSTNSIVPTGAITPAPTPRPAILAGTNGRMTTLGQPLFRQYDPHIADLL